VTTKTTLCYLILCACLVCSISCGDSAGGSNTTGMPGDSTSDNQMQLCIIQTAPASKYSGEVSEGEPFSDYYMELYDRQERLLLGYNASDSVLNQKRVSKCDDKGNMVELAIYDNNESLQNRIVCEYDDNDNISGFIRYDSANAVETSRAYEYGSEENMTEFRHYNSQGELQNKIVYEYDSSGNMVEWTRYDKYDDCDGRQIIDYDENGNVIKQDYYSGSGNLYETVNYNADGSIEESIHYSGDGSVYSRQTNAYLQYDEHQNWTKCMLSKKVYGGTELFVQYRTIVYYGDGCNLD